MTPDRATAPTLAAAAVIAALAIGSAVFMVASGDIDASALKDIGLDRSEISSVGAELCSSVLRTRRNLVCE